MSSNPSVSAPGLRNMAGVENRYPFAERSAPTHQSGHKGLEDPLHPLLNVIRVAE